MIQSSIKPERIYIGSAVNIERRINRHRHDLRKNIHDNRKIQHHYDKYGEDDLEFFILCGCDKEHLIENEQFFMDSLNPWFNLRPKADSNFGWVPSQETRAKNSRAHIGQVNSEESRRQQADKIRGRKHSEETKQKMSGKTPWNKGKVGVYSERTLIQMRTNNARRGNSPWNKGKKFSPESCFKMAKNKIGNKNGKGNLGNVMPPIVREKIKEGLIRYWKIKKLLDIMDSLKLQNKAS